MTVRSNANGSILWLPALAVVSCLAAGLAAQPSQAPAAPLERLPQARTIIASDCSAARVGESIPTNAIGEPVGAVTIAAPRWVPATDTLQARCEADGSIEPVDRSATARPIRFRVWLPADWNGRAVHQGGGGMNGSIPDLSGGRYPIGGRSAAQLGFATFGSDSGHQMTPGPQDWALNDEALKNLGYAQTEENARRRDGADRAGLRGAPLVIPQAGHGLSGSVYGTDGEGRATTPGPIPSDYERFAYLVTWVERGVAPRQALHVSAGGKTLPLCSYPTYPKYVSGPPATASSYTCSAPNRPPGR